MIAVDTNILVYAHRGDSSFHEQASRTVQDLAEGRGPWAIPWPCLHEFLAVVTHPRIYQPPTPVDRAVDQVSAWLESPSLLLLSEDEGYFDVLAQLVAAGQALGPKVHDARIAALCLHHGIGELLTADRDFGRFADLRVRNPLLRE